MFHYRRSKYKHYFILKKRYPELADYILKLIGENQLQDGSIAADDPVTGLMWYFQRGNPFPFDIMSQAGKSAPSETFNVAMFNDLCIEVRLQNRPNCSFGIAVLLGMSPLRNLSGLGVLSGIRLGVNTVRKVSVLVGVTLG